MNRRLIPSRAKPESKSNPVQVAPAHVDRKLILEESTAHMEVFTSFVFDETLHFLTLPDGSHDEAWDVVGIERLMNKHLGSDAGVAKHFFRRVDQLFPAGYEMTVTIRDADIYHITITCDGKTEVYPNRFVFFES
ncbi:Hypothetical protein NGAL_HAMBI490_05880 [Neorhizobium galegae bv. officinalis]|nr:Hypothetical protein NGAL_HAMBI490_05880 [Neorhizobium galegae bv. officinalis]